MTQPATLRQPNERQALLARERRAIAGEINIR
jgi:hypothetical protein